MCSSVLRGAALSMDTSLPKAFLERRSIPIPIDLLDLDYKQDASWSVDIPQMRFV